MLIIFLIAFTYNAVGMVNGKPNAKKFLIRWVVAQFVIGTFSNMGSHPNANPLTVAGNSVAVILMELAAVAVIAMIYKAFLKIKGTTKNSS